ncbi:MAG: cysteine--tRNA ligase [Sorangiineae bacterium]|nr:cysteine--tRNA ligase [Polyangiaceae bacterium]MEB2320954.1 cysteine--tRNA ligase [Sorangiineae bacterium]
MTTVRLYNTLTRTLEEVTPMEPGKVRIYCCGPTVYDLPHAGHARAALAPDLLVRHLRARGLEVTYVRNITDVDDKILARARERGEEPLELSRRMATAYQEKMKELGCLAPDHEPKVSEHLEDIFALITELVASEHAYVVELAGGRRDVYFSVRSFPDYGKLSRRKIDDLMVGARVEKGESKRDPLDFALWKGGTADEWGWDSPWGRGRPGWHIECSAMSSHYLGRSFDIHAGGMDLIFPHHENEIAQSEAAHPEATPMARIWMHNGFVNVDKEKMSKSLGNFVTVEDVLARNDAEGFRWFLLGVQYRGPIQFDTEKLESGRVVFPGVDEAERRVDYMVRTRERLRELLDSSMTAPAKLPPELTRLRDAANQALEEGRAALDDDLNTPVALAALGEIARIANEVADLALKRRKDSSFVGAAAVAARLVEVTLGKLAGELGVLSTPVAEYRLRTRERRVRLRGLTADAIDRLVDERALARKNRDFARSDAIRDELAALGVVLKDSLVGSEWSIDV